MAAPGQGGITSVYHVIAGFNILKQYIEVDDQGIDNKKS